MQFPVALAVAGSRATLPEGPFAFEPKYDGWRTCAHGGRGRLHTRSGHDVTSRFPEIAEAVSAFGDVVLDGELVAAAGLPPRLEFTALQAGPARRKARGIGVYLLAFDLLAADGQDLRFQPYPQRHALLKGLLEGNGLSRVQSVPSTQDREQALQWLDPSFGEVGIEGVVTKPLSRPYRAGKASGWLKTHHVRTCEAVIAGVSGTRERPQALVLAGRNPATGRWRTIGMTSPITAALRAELAPRLVFTGQTPARLPGIVTGLPGSADRDYWPTYRELVIEIATDGMAEHGRWRHPVRAVRLRSDLAAADLAVHL